MRSRSAVSTQSAKRSSRRVYGSSTTAVAPLGLASMAMVFSREEASLLLMELSSRPLPHGDRDYSLMRGIVARLERGIEAIDAHENR